MRGRTLSQPLQLLLALVVGQICLHSCMAGVRLAAPLGFFAAAVALVRLLIPALAKRLHESQVLFGAMLCTAAVFTVYPFVRSACRWVPARCCSGSRSARCSR